ncbi:MAG: aldose 1-epimerase [Saprospiraceae bacterium]|nr:MAG: aldose 1-epimerase [Saprospiraceae bacterium]
MFKSNHSPFGKYEKITIGNGRGSQFTVLPGFGGCLLEVQLDGVQVLDGYKTPLEVDINRWYKNVLLYPFPNRLKNGQYTWKGKTYQFPINDTDTETALHGFGVNKSMKVDMLQCQESSASIVCVYDYQGDLEAFPFPFRFCANFEINDSGAFVVRLSATNTGSQIMPFGFGWHPYFALSEAVGDTALQMPACELIGVDGNMIPTGKRYAFDDFTNPQKIGTTVLDNAFALSTSENQAHFSLNSSQGKLTGWVETGPKKYKYLQVFTPPYRGAIAVEPMTCNIDAFNNGDCLMEIGPGEEVSAGFGFRFNLVGTTRTSQNFLATDRP